jgi:hypothetical protein
MAVTPPFEQTASSVRWGINGATGNRVHRSPWDVSLGVSPFPADFTLPGQELQMKCFGNRRLRGNAFI